MGEKIIKRHVCDITGRGHKGEIQKYRITVGLDDTNLGPDDSVPAPVLSMFFDAGKPGLDSLVRAITRKLSGPKPRPEAKETT